MSLAALNLDQSIDIHGQQETVQGQNGWYAGYNSISYKREVARNAEPSKQAHRPHGKCAQHQGTCQIAQYVLHAVCVERQTQPMMHGHDPLRPVLISVSYERCSVHPRMLYWML